MELCKICILSFASLVILFAQRAVSESSKIDEVIEKLNYDPKTILSYTGKPVTVKIKKKGRVEDNNFIVTESKKQSLAVDHAELGLVKTNIQRSFPGSIILVSPHMAENRPDVVREDQKPLTYTLDLPDLPKENVSFTTTPTYADYTAGANKVLQGYLETENHTNVVPDVELKHTLVHSKDHIRCFFGPEIADSSIETRINFYDIENSKRIVMLQRYRIQFYSVSAQVPEKPSEVFADNVSAEDLKRRITDKNPPVIVDSVTFGKHIYVLVETSSVEPDSRAFIENQIADLKGHDLFLEDLRGLLKDLKITVFIMSSGNQNFEEVKVVHMADIDKAIQKQLRFGPKNTGYPIYYTGVFLKDQSQVKLASKTDYIEVIESIVLGGILSLEHIGWYVCYWNVNWAELSYDEQGNEVYTPKKWDDNDVGKTAPNTDRITMPGNRCNITVSAQYLTISGAYPLVDAKNVPLIRYRSFEATGSTWTASCTINPPL